MTDIAGTMAAAVSHHYAGRFEDASRLYRVVLALDPDHVEALHHLGLASYQRGDAHEAIALMDRAISLDGSNARHHVNRGLVLRRLGRLDDAEASYRRALAIDAGSAEAWNNLATLLAERGDLGAAIASCNAALRLAPDYPFALNNLGNFLHRSGDFEASEAAYRRAIAASPSHADAHSNLGYLLRETGRYDEALHCFDEAIAIDPNHAGAHLNRGQVRLLQGDFERGWQDFEWRWRYGDYASPRFRLPSPVWRGEDVAGRTVVLYAEEGLGDAIQFLRYVPLVKARGAEVVLLVPGKLHRLLEYLPGEYRVVHGAEALPAHDFHRALMDLPAIFHTDLGSIPTPGAYLRVPRSAIQRWSERVGGAGCRVGLVWAGRPEHGRDRYRSIACAEFAPLARAPGIRLFSLQKGPGAAQAVPPPPGMALEDLAPELDDLADAAAAICALDLVISVDTSVAHLAGALGKPVWILLAAIPDWRWMLARTDSPWYSSARLFRQARLGEWAPVITEVAAALEGVCKR
jgi:Flp pilus assembly protein TadD